MVDWSNKFINEYRVARASVAKSDDFEKAWQPLVARLEKLMGEDGFDAAEEPALYDLRSHITKGPSQTRHSEDKGILQAVKAWTEGEAGTIELGAKKRAASLKFLRHVYLQNKAGNRRVWIFSLPVEFTDWPSRFLETHASTAGAAKRLLVSKGEHFNDQQRRYLGNSTQQAMAWCQKASVLLANAATAVGSSAQPERAKARDMVRRWFAETGLSDATLETHIATLSKGFKDIIATLNRGHFVVTDWVPFRGTTDADEAGFLASEAFTFRNRHEGMDVVYIESNFFTDDPGGVVHGQANWTRIIVHELSHLVCGTVDVKNGQDRYAWYGIGPHAGYPISDCVRNADNWAFFAADCGGALTDAERNKALKVI
jgi:hypothetical protein